MDDVYEELARHLDRLPAGFPRTDSEVELRILKRLFSPEEARMAARLSMVPENASEIAERLGLDRAELEPRLEDMAGKGLIFRLSREQETKYMAAQFMVGIWEYHVHDLDQDLIRDVNEYLPHLMQNSWMQTSTKQLRVIPVQESIEGQSGVMPYDQAKELVRMQSRIAVAPCICRKEHQMVGQGCGRPLETCLIFGAGARFYLENGWAREISADEALQILEQGLKQGLVLQPGNAQKPANICLCCGCCCQVLKNLKSLPEPAAAIHSNFTARVQEELCTACGQCEEICQMQAISVQDTAQVDGWRCIGCGLCVSACDAGAISLQQKEQELKYEPPKNMVQTYLSMAQERGLL
ncbi:MAG: 4Fe-4S dicluster domain-containing protein [Desulfohalobiaceae bacterium]